MARLFSPQQMQVVIKVATIPLPLTRCTHTGLKRPQSGPVGCGLTCIFRMLCLNLLNYKFLIGTVTVQPAHFMVMS